MQLISVVSKRHVIERTRFRTHVTYGTRAYTLAKHSGLNDMTQSPNSGVGSANFRKLFTFGPIRAIIGYYYVGKYKHLETYQPCLIFDYGTTAPLYGYST